MTTYAVPTPCTEEDGETPHDDRIDRLGRLFCMLRLNERHGITFEQYVHLVEIGEWERVAEWYKP